MPDPVLILTAMGVAAAVAAVLVLAGVWPWRTVRSFQSDAGWVLGVGAGFFTGCWILGLRPHWPLLEDLDRLFAVVLPASLVTELLAALPRVPRPFVWALHLAIVASGAGILLYGSSYLTDMSGPGTAEWSPAQIWFNLGILAVIEGIVWALLAILVQRAPGVSHAVCLAGTSAAAAITVMLSGYATGGQIGLPLAGALAGASLAVFVLPCESRSTGPVGVAVVGLFSLLVVGRYFGQLTSAHAILLFCAPLLGWIPELPYLRRLPAWARGLTRVILVAGLTGLVVALAQRNFTENSEATSSAQPNEPTFQDYMDSRP
jgi:hypothetical protein